MPNLYKNVVAFDGGELSELLLRRIDTPQYSRSLKIEENFYTLETGAAKKARGTLFNGALRNNDQRCKFVPYNFDEQTKFLIVINDGFFQFVDPTTDSFLLAPGGGRYEVACPYTEAMLPNLRYAQSGNVLYFTHQDVKPMTLQRITATNWQLAPLDITYNAISDLTFVNAAISFKIINGTIPFKTGTKFYIHTLNGAIDPNNPPEGPIFPDVQLEQDATLTTTGDNINLGGLQDIDSRTIAGGNRILVRDQLNPAENGIWISQGNDGQDPPQPIPWTRATDFDEPSEINGKLVHVGYGSAMSDTYWRVKSTVTTVGTDPIVFESAEEHGNGTIAGVVSTPGSSTSETFVITCIASTATRQEWTVVGTVSGSLPLYWKNNDYPKAVTFFESRLFFGGSKTYPQTLWGSSPGDYNTYTLEAKDGGGVIVTIAGNDYNPINHLVSSRELLIFTYSSEFSMTGPNGNAISGVSSNIIRDSTHYGINSVRPIRVGDEILFPQRDGRKVHALGFAVEKDSNTAPNITLFAEHITRPGPLIDAAYAQNPDNIAWFVRADGAMAALTLNRDYDVTAWSRHTTDGAYENVSVLTGTTSDETYVCVRRVINGVTKRYVERMDYSVSDKVNIRTNPTLMHSASIYDGAATTVVTGLQYLEGKSVNIIADGYPKDNKTVLNGQITLERPASYVEVGLPYDSTIQFYNPEFGDANNSTQGRKSALFRCIIAFYETTAAYYNKGGANDFDEYIPFLEKAVGLDLPIPLFTGTKDFKLQGWGVDHQPSIKVKGPTDCTILGVEWQVAIND